MAYLFSLPGREVGVRGAPRTAHIRISIAQAPGMPCPWCQDPNQGPVLPPDWESRIEKKKREH